MATAAQLFSESAGFIGFGVTEVEALILALEAQWLIALAPSANVSAAALMAYGNCYQCFTGGSAFDTMNTALLDQISTAS